MPLLLATLLRSAARCADMTTARFPKGERSRRLKERETKLLLLDAAVNTGSARLPFACCTAHAYAVSCFFCWRMGVPRAQKTATGWWLLQEWEREEGERESAGPASPLSDKWRQAAVGVSRSVLRACVHTFCSSGPAGGSKSKAASCSDGSIDCAQGPADCVVSFQPRNGAASRGSPLPPPMQP